MVLILDTSTTTRKTERKKEKNLLHSKIFPRLGSNSVRSVARRRRRQVQDGSLVLSSGTSLRPGANVRTGTGGSVPEVPHVERDCCRRHESWKEIRAGVGLPGNRPRSLQPVQPR